MMHDPTHITVQWGSNFSMQKDRETDMTKLVVGFRNFAKAPKTKIVENIHPRPTRNVHINKPVGTHIL